MCQQRYFNPTKCNKCKKAIKFLESRRIPCQDSKDSGIACPEERRDKTYTRGDKTREIIQSWLNCPRCSAAPENYMASVSLATDKFNNKSTIICRRVKKDNPFQRPPRRSADAQWRHRIFARQDEQKPRIVETLEMALSKLRLEKAIDRLELGVNNGSEDVEMN